MNVVEAALRRVAGQLDGLGQPWALVGGFAVSARAEPRFTRDVDVAVAVPDDTSAEALVQRMASSGYRAVTSVEQDAVSRLATVRMETSGDDDVVVDLLFASSGIEPEIVAWAETVEILPGLAIPVARIGHLIAVKLLAVDDEQRPLDRSDLHSLRQAASEEDMEMARAAVSLITVRGYARDRDLTAALSALSQ